MRSAKAYTALRNNTKAKSIDSNPHNVSPKEAERAFVKSRFFKDPKVPYMITTGSAHARGEFTCYTITVHYRDEYGTAHEMFKDVKFVRFSKDDVQVWG